MERKDMKWLEIKSISDNINDLIYFKPRRTCNGMLVDMYAITSNSEPDERIGYFDMKGFHYMLGMDKRFSVEESFKAVGGTWFSVFMLPRKDDDYQETDKG